MGNKLDKIQLTEEESKELIEALPPAYEAAPGPYNPTEVEKQLVAEEQARLNQSDPEEIACMMIKLYTPRFNALIDSLSKRGIARVTKALMEFPLGKNYSHRDKKEAEAFQIGQALNDAKMVLVVKTYHENKDKIEALAAEASANTETLFGENAQEGSN